MDEIIDVIQDAINANVGFTFQSEYLSLFLFQYKAWYAKTKEDLQTLTEKTFPTALVMTFY